MRGPRNRGPVLSQITQDIIIIINILCIPSRRSYRSSRFWPSVAGTYGPECFEQKMDGIHVIKDSWQDSKGITEDSPQDSKPLLGDLQWKPSELDRHRLLSTIAHLQHILEQIRVQQCLIYFLGQTICNAQALCFPQIIHRLQDFRFHYIFILHNDFVNYSQMRSHCL